MEPHTRRRARLRLRCLAYREGTGWTAECLEVGLAVHGDTLQEARHALDEAIDYLASEVARLRREGARPTVRRVPRYYWKRLKWSLSMSLQTLRRASPSWEKLPDQRLQVALA